MADRKTAPARKSLGYALVILGLVLVLILVFVKSSYDSQGALLCENINASGGDMNACPVHKTDTSWFFMGGFSISVLIVFAGAYFGFVEKPSAALEEARVGIPTRAEATEPQAKPTIASVSRLDPDSRKILELLQARNGSMFQSELVREAGFSKVKITRILDRLEQENLVERRRRGMANLVLLK